MEGLFLPKDAVSTYKLDTGTDCCNPSCPFLAKEHQIPPACAPVAALLIGHQVMRSSTEQEAQSFEVAWGIHLGVALQHFKRNQREK